MLYSTVAPASTPLVEGKCDFAAGGDITGDIGLADLNLVQALYGFEIGLPGLPIIDAVLNGHTAVVIVTGARVFGQCPVSRV